MLRCKSACSSGGVIRLSCRLRNPGCSGCSPCKGVWSGSSKRPGALPRCSVRERASYRSWRCDYCAGTVSAQLGAVGSLGKERRQLPHRTHCSAFWNPQHQSVGSSARLLHQLSKGLRRRAPWMTEGDPRGSSKRALPSVLCCLLTSRSPVSRPGQ